MLWGEIKNKLKNLSTLLGSLFLWIAPLALFIWSTYIPKIIWNPSFKDYLEFLKILIWPYTVLVILFFFRKVVTFLFFSMDGFNFFGAKGTLKNVNEVIVAEVNKKFMEEKQEAERKKTKDELNAEIRNKENEIRKAKGSADENLDLAKEIMIEWKKATKQSGEIISELEKENKRLKEIVSGLPVSDGAKPEASSFVIDESKTSDQILVVSSKDKQ